MSKTVNLDLETMEHVMAGAREYVEARASIYLSALGGGKSTWRECTKSGRWQPLTIQDHPLKYWSGYTLVTRHDPKFGNVPVYKARTRAVSDIIGTKQTIPHTNIHYQTYQTYQTYMCHMDYSKRLALIAWIRRHKTSELEQAVATLLMMNLEPVLVRSFEP